MNKTIQTVWASLMILISLSGLCPAEIRLPSILGDNMVLQQNSKVAVWGWADPGQTISVKGSWGGLLNFGKKTRADADGRWKVMLKTPKAGGPYTLSIKGENQITLSNVLIGEVWLCSGQSNMEWPLSRVDNAPAEQAAADCPDIRLFLVEKATAAAPADQCRGTWKVCSPQSAAPFSAVGYYFARQLRDELNVPVGMIGTYWGGTVAEAWICRRALEPFADEFKNQLRKLDTHPNKQPMPANQIWTIRETWAEKLLESDPGIAGRWYVQTLDDSRWGSMPVPAYWGGDGLDKFDGILWYRKTIRLPEDWTDRPLTLELGRIDDADKTWFNGRQIGQTNDFQAHRKYTIPAGLAKPANNTLALQVLDKGSGGGMIARPDQIKIYPQDAPDRAIPLAGTWKYKVALSYTDLPGYTDIEPLDENTPSALYNAMIAPLIPFRIRGALWYQGESNCGRAEQYSRLLPALIQNWRQDWGYGDFPFYFVQIAPYNYGNPDDPTSAFLREAQMKTLSVKNTGMAVTMDIGNPDDIHPRNKKDVGRRLALWALAKDYGRKNLVYSGPLYKGMKIEGDKIRLFFDHVGSGLIAKGGPLTHFTIAGKDRKFVPAEAVIDGDTIVVSAEAVPRPVAVRYAFTNAAQPNLFNKEGLPASSFRTDNDHTNPD